MSNENPKATDQAVSRLLSHALRHEPWKYQIDLDEDGWATIGQVIAAIQEQGPAWRKVGTDDLRRVVDGAGGGRHEYVEGRIRARYGHSVRQLPGFPVEPPPASLYHGTSRATVEAVLREGLLPQGRQYVHLSVRRSRAEEVGRRRDEAPVLLLVMSGKAMESGVEFHRATDSVWLARWIPPNFIGLIPQ